jgi:hypothetical protein
MEVGVGLDDLGLGDLQDASGGLGGDDPGNRVVDHPDSGGRQVA